MNFFSRRVRGFRLLDLIGLSLLVMIIVGVYLAKTMAGSERSEIAKIERQIGAEKARIRLLQAEVAHLERPGRIERLSVSYLQMEPVPANREATAEQLAVLASSGPAPKAAAVSSVATMVNNGAAKMLPGVPPPPPAEANPVRVAEAQVPAPAKVAR